MVKLGVRNFMLIGVMAILFIVITKVLVNKYPDNIVSKTVSGPINAV